mmetsp:Transcript_17307/g.43434  ORF Transcript_17307/g.43434 Transcript_17307/m.43434 type:complete len:212 (+) Transcript_17307:1823-2458(+)
MHALMSLSVKLLGAAPMPWSRPACCSSTPCSCLTTLSCCCWLACCAGACCRWGGWWWSISAGGCGCRDGCLAQPGTSTGSRAPVVRSHCSSPLLSSVTAMTLMRSDDAPGTAPLLIPLLLLTTDSSLKPPSSAGASRDTTHACVRRSHTHSVCPPLSDWPAVTSLQLSGLNARHPTWCCLPRSCALEAVCVFQMRIESLSLAAAMKAPLGE